MKSWLINFLFISKRHVQVKVLSIGIHVTRNVQATVSKSALLCYMSSMYHERKMSSYILVSQSSVSCQSVQYTTCSYYSARVGRYYIYQQFSVYYFSRYVKVSITMMLFAIHSLRFQREPIWNYRHCICLAF